MELISTDEFYCKIKFQDFQEPPTLIFQHFSKPSSSTFRTLKMMGKLKTFKGFPASAASWQRGNPVFSLD